MFASPRNQLPLFRFAHPSLFLAPLSRHPRHQSTHPPPPPPPPPREPTSLDHELDRVCVSDRSFWTRKIHDLCTRHRNVDAALRLLDHLRLRGYRPDPLNLSSVVHALCDAGRFEEARRRLVSFVSSGYVVPDERTCNTIVARLLDSRDPRGTLRVIRCLADVKPGYVCSLTNFNRLIDQWCCISRPNYGHRVFLDMKSWGHRPSCVSYTTLINGYCKVGDVRAAQKLFDEMVEEGIRPNSLTFSALVSGFLRRRDGERARELIVRLWQVMKCEEDSFVSNAAFADLIDSLCREGFFDEVFQIAESMPQGLKAVAEEHAYGQMIDSLCKFGRHHGASRIVYIMRKRGISPSLASYNSIVHGLSKQGACMRACQLLEEGIEFGYLPSEYTYKVLVEALCQESDLPKAREVLHVMLNKEGVQKTRIYNIYLRALCLVNNPTELLNVLVSMLQSNCQPDVISLNTIIHGFCKTGRVEDALKILHDMITGKFRAPDAVTFTTVISGLLDVGKSQEALDLLHHAILAENSKPSVVTYNAVLRGLFKLSKVKEAEDIFISMKNHGVAADCTTYSILIDGLCNCNQVDKAKRLWDDVIWPSKVHDNYVYAALLKGICTSGDLDGACHFLYELVDSGVSPNIFCYNILIDKACKLGLKREAYQILGEMKKNGLAPDAVTWRTLDKLHSCVKMQSYSEDSSSQSEEDLVKEPDFFNSIGFGTTFLWRKSCTNTTLAASSTSWGSDSAAVIYPLSLLEQLTSPSLASWFPSSSPRGWLLVPGCSCSERHAVAFLPNCLCSEHANTLVRSHLPCVRRSLLRITKQFPNRSSALNHGVQASQPQPQGGERARPPEGLQPVRRRRRRQDLPRRALRRPLRHRLRLLPRRRPPRHGEHRLRQGRLHQPRRVRRLLPVRLLFLRAGDPRRLRPVRPGQGRPDLRGRAPPGAQPAERQVLPPGLLEDDPVGGQGWRRERQLRGVQDDDDGFDSW